MMGLDNAGKSTALYRLKTGQYCETIPTIGFNCEKIRGRTAKTDRVTFTIWDVGGQERVRPLWRTYAKSAQGILFVLDSADSDTLEEAKVELEQMLKYTDNPPIPILVLANKQDLPDACDLAYLKSYLFSGTVDSKINHGVNVNHHRRPVEIVSVCAITGENLDEALELLYEMITRKSSSTTHKPPALTSNIPTTSTTSATSSSGFASSSLSSSSSSNSSSVRSKLFNK